MSDVVEALVALTATLYVPAAVPVGDVTVTVAEPLFPGASDNEVVFQLSDHPDGTASPKLKIETEHPEVSLFISVTVKLTGVPGVTP
jgi:hypothetical protein